MSNTSVKLHKVEPTLVSRETAKMTVELARKGKSQAESVSCWITFQAPTGVSISELDAASATEILTNWFAATQAEMLREETRAAYAGQREEFEVDLSLAGIFSYWKASAAAGRFDASAIQDWFKSSNALATIVAKLTAANLDPKQLEAIVAKSLATLASCAAPVPNISLRDAEKLLPYLAGDTSAVASFVARKLQSVIAKSRKADLDLL